MKDESRPTLDSNNKYQAITFHFCTCHSVFSYLCCKQTRRILALYKFVRSIPGKLELEIADSIFHVLALLALDLEG